MFRAFCRGGQTKGWWATVLAALTLLGASSVAHAQTLHQLVADANPGDTIVLGAQTYVLDQRLVIDKSLTIVGQGRDLTFIEASAGFTDDRLFNIGGTLANPLANVRLADFTLDAMSNTNVGQGIAMSHGSGHSVENLRIRNIAATTFPHGIFGSTNVTDSVFAGNEILNIGEHSEWGAGIRLSGGSGGNLIDGNFISDVGRGGILLNNGSRDTRIVNNVVQNIGLLNPNPDPLVRLGIEVWGTSLDVIDDNRNVVIEDNQMDHWLSVSTQADVAVRRNIVTGPQLGDGIGFSGLEAVTAERVIFTDNVVAGGQHLGISTSSTGVEDLIFWARNTIQNAETWGAQIQGDTGGAHRMYFYDNVIEGTRGTAASLFPSQAGHAMRFNDNAFGIVLDSNQLVNNDGAAIQLLGSNLDQFVVIDNLITGNDRAIAGSFPGDDLHWANNTVAGNNINNSLSSKGFPDGPPPTPTINVTGDLLVGIILDLKLLGMDSVTLTDVLWDLGEGIPLTGEQIQYAYLQEGEHLVSAIAWTDYGFGVLAQTTLTIVPEPATIALVGVFAAAILRRRL